MGRRHRKKRRKNNSKKTNPPISDLIIAIDRSQKRLQKTRVTIYSWVEIEAGPRHQELKQKGGWLKHVAELRKEQRTGYRKRFQEKFPTQLRPLFNRVDISPNPRVFKKRLETQNYKILLLEDKLYEKQKFPRDRAIPENQAKKDPNYRPVMLVADNVAYFGRELYEKKYDNKPLSKAEIKARLRKLGINLIED